MASPTINTFIVMGRPGSGKSTQAMKLSELTGFPVFSSGARARSLAEGDTHLGHKIGELINHGNLMPAWLASFLFEDAILRLEPTEGIIFEGAGRTKAEAELFHEVMTWLERGYRVFNLEVPEAKVRERLIKRAEIEGRTDDRLENLDTRFREYNEHTLRALDFFRSQGTLVEVNGDQDLESVFREIEAGMSRL